MNDQIAIFLKFIPSSDFAKELMEDISIAELLTEDHNKQIRKDVLCMLEQLNKQERPKIDIHLSEAQKFLKHYLITRLFLSYLHSERLTRFYHMLFYRILKELWKVCHERGILTPEVYPRLLEHLNLSLIEEGQGIFALRIHEFLSVASYLHWKLVDFKIRDGLVYFPEKDMKDLILGTYLVFERHRVAIAVENFHFDVSDITQLQELATSLQADLNIIPSTTTHVYPPCIRKIIEDLKQKHVGHQPRLILTTYLLSINKPKEEIIELLVTDPKFDRNTRYDRAEIEYQLQSLLDQNTESSKRARYLFSCRSVKQAEYCFPDNFCRVMFASKHISNYPQNYRKKKDQVIRN